MTVASRGAFEDYRNLAGYYLHPTIREVISAMVVNLDTTVMFIEVSKSPANRVRIWFVPAKGSTVGKTYPNADVLVEIKRGEYSTQEMIDLDVVLKAEYPLQQNQHIISTPGYRLWPKQMTGHDAGADLARIVDKYCYER